MITRIFILRFFVLLFLVVTSGFIVSKEESGGKLKIGILRHLTIEQSEKLLIDTHAEKMLIAEAESRGHQIEFVHPMQLVYSTMEKRNYDVIISRPEIDDFSEKITESYLRALDYFDTLGIPIINSTISTINAQDKFRTLLLVHKAGIRIPLTFIVYDLKDIEHLLNSNKIVFPFFTKKPYGGGGDGVYFVKNNQQLVDLIIQDFKKGDPILVEESIDLETDEQGSVKDMRIWVVRDAVTDKARFVGGVYRTAPLGNNLTNIHRGGTVLPMKEPCDREIVRVAELALESIGGDVAGIDLARDKNGTVYLLEINISFFTSKEVMDTMGINIWKLVLDLAEARVKRK